MVAEKGGMSLRQIEVMQSVPEEERLAFFAKDDREREPNEAAGDVAGKMGNYISEHPTSFAWRADVRAIVRRVEARWPWLTYINTYRWHPPYDPPAITMRYDARSFDVWGGGLTSGEYTGYRGKPLPDHLHAEIWNYLFNYPGKPDIYWACTNGWLWTYYGGWSRYNPPDPYNADMGHFRHIHITYRGD